MDTWSKKTNKNWYCIQIKEMKKKKSSLFRLLRPSILFTEPTPPTSLDTAEDEKENAQKCWLFFFAFLKV